MNRESHGFKPWEDVNAKLTANRYDNTGPWWTALDGDVRPELRR